MGSPNNSYNFGTVNFSLNIWQNPFPANTSNNVSHTPLLRICKFIRMIKNMALKTCGQEWLFQNLFNVILIFVFHVGSSTVLPLPGVNCPSLEPQQACLHTLYMCLPFSGGAWIWTKIVLEQNFVLIIKWIINSESCYSYRGGLTPPNYERSRADIKIRPAKLTLPVVVLSAVTDMAKLPVRLQSRCGMSN